MEPPSSLSNIFHDISDFFKKLLASDAVSGFFHMISELIKKIMSSDGVQSAIKWCKKEKVISVAIVAVIGLLMICCCCKCLKNKKFRGKTMKAPGQDCRLFRSDFEASPSDYFRNLRSPNPSLLYRQPSF